MMPSLKRLIVLALFASLGLVALQAFWLVHEWKNDKEVIQRQATTALKEAVHQELEARRDTLRYFLRGLLNDTTFFKFSTLYLPRQKVWSIKLADAGNPADYTNWTNKNMPVGPVLGNAQKQKIISTLVNEHITQNSIMYYTQRLGNAWKARFDSLRLDKVMLQSLFRKELEAAKLSPGFTLRYIDTSVDHNIASPSGGKISTSAVGVQYGSIWDSDGNYAAVADINNPFVLLLKRLWVTIAASFLLLLLTLYCMFRMYRVIRQQKQLADIKNDFISNITHELKTPLATVSAAIDALQYFNSWDKPERKEKYLNTSRSEIQRLNGLLSQIMDTALYEQGNVLLQKEWLNVPGILREVSDALSVQYAIELDYTLTADHANARVFADRIQLTCVIRNILENAIKYHPNKSAVQISISIQQAPGKCVIGIKDNGPGIPAEHQPFLFDKFYRVPQLNGHNIKGFGLGLYYVRKIVEAHSGTVIVRSQVQSGTAVSIELPQPHGASE